VKRLIFKVMGGLHTALYRLTGGWLGGKTRGVPVLLLTVRGRKSGKVRTVPLLYGRDGERYVIVASKGGDPKHPAWYLNLRGGDGVVEIGRDRIRVRAHDAQGEERERLWALMVGLYPPYAEYQQKTERLIPVVVLEPGDPSPRSAWRTPPGESR
jgi:deazaflavin-dependent oxidoreductase (nitroreductase family)